MEPKGKSHPSKISRKLGLSPNVFFLGLVSFLTDVSSEMIFTVLPLFLNNVLRVSMPMIGLIEGIAESTATLLKIISGWLSDRVGRRKRLAAFGYGLSTVAKPLLYFAASWGPVLGVRFADRIGKGIRSSPRDALIADSASSEQMGRSFGFHRMMDTAGAMLGIAIAAGIVYWLQQENWEITRSTYQILVLVGTVPAVIAVGVIIFFVHDNPAKKTVSDTVTIAEKPSKQGFDNRFKTFLIIMILFSLGNSSDAFVILRAHDLGLSVFDVLLVMIFFNMVYALVAFPAGALSDRLGRKRLIITGWAIYTISYLGFATASNVWQVWILFGVYGIYHGITEGVARAFVADMVPSNKRGTAYGMFHAAIGISVLPASVIAGWLWTSFSPSAPFYFGAVLAGVSSLLLVAIVRK